MSRYREWAIDQPLLLPPSVTEFVPPDHLSIFVRELARSVLDLSAIERTYSRDPRGNPPYHPAMLVALLLYAHAQGVYSSWRIAEACEERVDFMALTAMLQPDFRTISDFRKKHLAALSCLFVQVLALCRDAGIVKLGHVALDGTKVPADASLHKAMSYKRMKEREPVLAAEVAQWLERSQETDSADDEEHGPDRRGDELPPHELGKIRKLKQMRESMARLEKEAQVEAKRVAAERAEREAARGKPLSGPKPKALDGVPPDKAQSNFTDPDSRILRRGRSYLQGYNAQAAVDAERQVIVAQSLGNQQNDVHELVPLVEQIEAHLGSLPRELSADSNYCSEANLEAVAEQGIRANQIPRIGRAAVPRPTRPASIQEPVLDAPSRDRRPISDGLLAEVAVHRNAGCRIGVGPTKSTRSWHALTMGRTEGERSREGARRRCHADSLFARRQHGPDRDRTRPHQGAPSDRGPTHDRPTIATGRHAPSRARIPESNTPPGRTRGACVLILAVTYSPAE